MSDQCVLSLSYGKDSIACLEACKQLGYPIDRVIHAEVWATDTIPADLPPMVEFKAKADAIIKERYGLTVEHLYATHRVERADCPTRTCSTGSSVAENGAEKYTASPSLVGLGARNSSTRKLTYEDIFYRPIKRQSRERERGFTASQSSRGIGVRATSNHRLCDSVESVLHRGTQDTSPYGFPISVSRGNWCTKLKQQVFR